MFPSAALLLALVTTTSALVPDVSHNHKACKAKKAAAGASNILIPATALSSPPSFYQYFENSYPWGTDHNGAARMAASQITVEDSTLTLNATRVKGQRPAFSGGKSIAIHYLSGAVHAKQHFTVPTGGAITYEGFFFAPVSLGRWPAFWLTGVEGWPPEIDMAEWKGDGMISFNTFNQNSVEVLDVEYPKPDEYHDIKCVTKDINGQDLQVDFYMDGNLVTTEVGQGYTNKAMWLIIDLQMEGSSGSPGPTEDSLFQIRNITVVQSTNSTA